MIKNIREDRIRVFENLVDNCTDYDLTQLDEDYMTVSCKKHGKTKRLYWRYVEKILENACIFCETAASVNDQKFLVRAKLEFIKDFELEGFIFDYFIPSLNLIVDKKVKYLRIPAKGGSTAEIRELNNSNLRDFYFMKETEFSKISEDSYSYISIKTWSELAPLLDKNKSFVNDKAKDEALNSKNFDYECDLGHQWSLAKKRSNPSCPYCSNREVLCGFNDFGCLNKSLLKEWNDDRDPHSFVTGSNSYVQWKCLAEGHTWSAPVKSRRDGANCDECSVKNKISVVKRNSGKLLKEVNPSLASEITKEIDREVVTPGTHRKIEWNCNNYDHTFFMSPNRRKRRNCTVCSGYVLLAGFNTISTYPEISKELVDSSKADTVSYRSLEPLEWQHINEADGKLHIWKATPSSRIQYNSGCHICINLLVTPGINDVATTHPKLAAQWSIKNTIKPTEISFGSNERILFECLKGHSWSALMKAASKGESRCLDCDPDSVKYRSKAEIDVENFVKSLLKDDSLVESNVRRFKSHGVHEIDIFVNELIAIDYNGDFWHQEGVFKPIGFHDAKSKALADLNLVEIAIWESDWVSNRPACEATIHNTLHEYFPELLKESIEV